MSDISEKYICSLLLDKSVRDRVKDDLLPVMLQSKLLRSLYKSLLELDPVVVDIRTLIPTMTKFDKTLNDSDINLVSQLVKDFIIVPEEAIDSAIDTIYNYVKQSKFNYVMNQVVARGMSEESAIREITDLSILTSHSTNEYTDLSDMSDLKSLVEEDMPQNGIIQSSIGVINDALTYKGYAPGDLIQVVAPPGTGKSTFLCQEGAFCLRNGKKVAHIILGDLNRFDVYTKYVARLQNMTIPQVVHDASNKKFYNLSVFRNLKLLIKEPYAMTVSDIDAAIKHLVNKDFKPDVIIIDYDLNIKSNDNDDSMYKIGGELYNALKIMAKTYNAVVFIASQPKSIYNNLELIPSGAASESARKLQIIDMMITMGKNQKCPDIGTMHLAKVRKGSAGWSIHIEFMGAKAGVRTIKKSEYDDKLKNYTSRDYEDLLREYDDLTEGLTDNVGGING